MKKLCVFLICAFLLLSGCGQDEAKGSKVFDTDKGIEAVVFETTVNGRKEIPVPEEYLTEVIEWLGTFMAGERVEGALPPGTNATRVTVFYADGTSVESGLNTVGLGGKSYKVVKSEQPEGWSAYFSGIVNPK